IEVVRLSMTACGLPAGGFCLVPFVVAKESQTPGPNPYNSSRNKRSNAGRRAHRPCPARFSLGTQHFLSALAIFVVDFFPIFLDREPNLCLLKVSRAGL